MSRPPQAQRVRHRWYLLSVLATIACLTASPASADSQRKHAFSSGATAVTGGGRSLGATIGEAGAVGSRTGPGFRLIEGFWQPGVGIATDVTPLLPPPGDPIVQYENALAATTPNPFREATTISFSVAELAPVRLAIYNVAGRKVTTLVNEERGPGNHQLSWNGHDEFGRPVAAGLYFALVEIGSWSGMERLLVLR